MLCNLFHENLVWMPSVGYIPNYYLQNWVYLYLLNRIGNLLTYVADLSLISVCQLWYMVRDTQNLLIAVGRRFESYT